MNTYRGSNIAWENLGFDPAHLPSNVFIREPIGKEPDEEEVEVEEDDTEDNEKIPDDDVLGAMTGIPTPVDAITRLVQSGRAKIRKVREINDVR